MEVIRKFIDANSLMSIMALPEAFRNRKLEIIVFPTDEETTPRQKADVLFNPWWGRFRIRI